jgi:hypothetical protein
MEEREGCYSFISSRTPHETTGLFLDAIYTLHVHLRKTTHLILYLSNVSQQEFNFIALVLRNVFYSIHNPGDRDTKPFLSSTHGLRL